MKKRLLFILCSIFVAANFAAAQNKTVTNSDLEKFRQKRLEAARDYRENYEKLGFPSPEELERQIEQDKKERSELAGQLRRESIERAKTAKEEAFLQAQIEILRSQSAVQNYPNGQNGNGFYSTGYLGSQPFYGYQNYNYSSGYYYNNRFRRHRGFGYGGSFYGAAGPGATGAQFNNGGVRINVTPGYNFPARIRSPRPR